MAQKPPAKYVQLPTGNGKTASLFAGLNSDELILAKAARQRCTYCGTGYMLNDRLNCRQCGAPFYSEV